MKVASSFSSIFLTISRVPEQSVYWLPSDWNLKGEIRSSVQVFLNFSLPWLAGLCINRWSLEELVKRDPHNFLILLQQILRKTKEVKSRNTNINFCAVYCYRRKGSGFNSSFFFLYRCWSSVSMSWWCRSRSCSLPPSWEWVIIYWSGQKWEGILPLSAAQ